MTPSTVVPRRLDSIQFLRGVAAMSVVMFHLMSVEAKYADGFQAIPDLFRFGQTGVDLFFVISGFVMALVTRPHWGNLDSVRFLAARAARIFPVYWFYCLVTLGVFLAMPRWVNSSGGEVDLLASFLLLPSTSLPLVMVAWSLVFEVYFYLVFALVTRLREQAVVPVLCLWGAALVAVNLVGPEIDDPWLALIANPHALQFISGVFVFLASRRWTRSPGVALPAILAAAALVLAYAAHLRFEVATLERALSLGLCFAALLWSCLKLEEAFPGRVPRLLVSLGDASYGIYLSHILVINAFGKFVSAPFFGLRETWASWAFFFLTLASVAVWSLLTHDVLERRPYAWLLRWIDRVRPSSRAGEC